jgi:CMP/dCMP kinase
MEAGVRITITVSGPPGSGTTTVARLLAERLHMQYVNTGAIFRAMAAERSMALNDFGQYVAVHPEIDQELDRRQADIAAHGGVILEGRLAGLMAKRAHTPAFCLCIGAERAVRGQRVAQRDNLPEHEALALMDERARGERQRYLQLYHYDLDDTSLYDLVIDSTNQSPDQIVHQVIRAYANHTQQRN